MKFIVSLFILLVSLQAFSAVSVGPINVHYVYQLDSRPTVFEFSTNTVNGCGSFHYRVKSPNVPVAERKFSLVLAAFIHNKKIMFADSQVCDGDRALVEWVRIVN